MPDLPYAIDLCMVKVEGGVARESEKSPPGSPPMVSWIVLVYGEKRRNKEGDKLGQLYVQKR